MLQKAKHKLTPEIYELLKNDEPIELIIEGGFASVFECLIVTDERLIVARQIKKRVVAVVFDREKDIWTELRPNNSGTDLLIFSPETMERIRGLSPETVDTVKDTFQIEEGDFETYTPPAEKMYHSFSGLRGSKPEDIIHSSSHLVFYLIYIVIFGSLCYESGFYVSALNTPSAWRAYLLLTTVSLLCALSTKRTFLVSLSWALAIPLFGLGLHKATGNTTSHIWFPDPLILSLTFLTPWLAAIASEAWAYQMNNRPLPVPKIGSLIAVSTAGAIALLATVHLNEGLAPKRLLKYSRDLKVPLQSCTMTLEKKEYSAVLINSTTHFMISCLHGGEEGPSEVWENRWTTTTGFPPDSAYKDGIILSRDTNNLKATKLLEGKTLWNYNVPDSYNFSIEPESYTASNNPTEAEFRKIISPVVILVWPNHTIAQKNKFHQIAAGQIISVDRNTGLVLWKHTFDLNWTGCPWAIPGFAKGSKDRIIVYSPGMKAIFVERTSGKEVLSRKLKPGTESIISTNHSLIVRESPQTVKALDSLDGRVLWSYIDSGTIDSPLYTHRSGEVVFLSNKPKAHLVFLNKHSGKVTFKIPIPKEWENSSLKMVHRDILYSSKGVFRFFRKEPERNFSFTLIDRQVIAPPVEENNRIYLATNDGTLFSINSIDGNLLWSYRTKGKIATGGILPLERGVAAYSTSGIFYSFHR